MDFNQSEQNTTDTGDNSGNGMSMNHAIVWTIVGVVVVVIVGVIVWMLTASTGPDNDAVTQGETTLDEIDGADGGNGLTLQDNAPTEPIVDTDLSPTIRPDTPPLATEDIIVDDSTEELGADIGDLDDFAGSDDLEGISSGLDDLDSL